jgi:C-methyltransferase C-terminal domain
LARLLEGMQYDTIYHEHYSYFSLTTIREVFAAHGLDVVDVEELPSHGGSLRVYGARVEAAREPTPAVAELLEREEAEGLLDPGRYRRFAANVVKSKRALLELLIGLKEDGKQVVGYGAPGKGNTLLNYCGIRTDFLDYTVDRNPYKHGRFTPGTHIPILPPEHIAETRPDAILILPWNLAREIAEQLAYTKEWGANLIVPIPTATVLESPRIAG